MTRDERTEQEMARGREIAARHAAEVAPAKTREDRLELIARYEDIHIPGLQGDVRRAFTVTRKGKNMVAILNGEEIAAEVHGPAFPTDQFVAQCALAVAALVPTEWVPMYSPARRRQIEERKRRDELRKHVIDWKKYPNGI